MTRRAVAGLRAAGALAIVLAIASLGTVGPASAAPQTIYSLPSTSSVGWQPANGSDRAAQSFSTGTDAMQLDSVTVYVRNASPDNNSTLVGDVDVALYTSAAGAPGSKVADLTSVTGYGGWGDGPVTASGLSTQLAASTDYFVVVSGTGTISFKFEAAAPTSSISPTPAFTALSSSDSGSSWTAMPSGSFFNMVVTADVVATPSAPASPSVTPSASTSPSVTPVAPPAPPVAPSTPTPDVASPTPTESPAPLPSPSASATESVSPSVVLIPTPSPSASRSSSDPESPVLSDVAVKVSSSPSTTAPAQDDDPATVAAASSASSPAMSPAPQSDASTGEVPVATFDAQPAAGQSLFTDETQVGPVLDVHADIAVGVLAAGRTTTVTAAGMEPGSDIVVEVHSDPQIIGRTTADAQGSATLTATIPAGLPAGQHMVIALGSGADHSQVQSVGAFVIDDAGIVTDVVQPGQVSAPVGPDDTQLKRALAAGKPLYDVALFPAVIATVAVAGATFLGLAGIGGLAGGGTAPSRPTRASRAKLAGLVTKKLQALDADEPGVGDHSSTWRMPGTAAVDRWISDTTVRSGRFSALMPRIMVDGAWSRAMFGSLGLLLWATGLALGVASAWSTGLQALPPALPLMLAIIGIGSLDAAAGAVAWLAITASALVAGHLSTWPEVRTVMGLFVLFVSVPLLAHLIRPLRRRINGSPMSWFDRAADYIMPTAALAFAASSMLKALNGLSGLELASPDDFGAVRVVVVVAFLVRMMLEDVTMYAYPARSKQAQPAKLASQERPFALLSVAMRVGIFLLIAEPFFGLGWMTFLSAALVATPMVLRVFEDDLPNLPWLHKWYPRGVARFTMLLVVGIYLSFWLLGQNATDDQVRQTYSFILLPGVMSGVIEFVGRKGGAWPENWWKRALGFVIWVFAVGLVTGAIALV